MYGILACLQSASSGAMTVAIAMTLDRRRSACLPSWSTNIIKRLHLHADVVQEAAKGAELWSIFDLMGYTAEEAFHVYQDAAEHDTPFSFSVTLKDKTEPFTMLFRSAIGFVQCCPQI